MEEVLALVPLSCSGSFFFSVGPSSSFAGCFGSDPDFDFFSSFLGLPLRLYLLRDFFCVASDAGGSSLFMFLVVWAQVITLRETLSFSSSSAKGDGITSM